MNGMRTRADLHPALAALLDDATAALAHLDVERLDALVLDSQHLLEAGNAQRVLEAAVVQPVELPRPLQEKLDAFARLLELTHENLFLMRRLGAHSAQLEYSAASLAGGRHGNH